MIKTLLWILIVQMLLNPFTVFVVVGVLTGGQLIGVIASLVVAFVWAHGWLKLRKRFATLDQQAADIWIFHRR